MLMPITDDSEIHNNTDKLYIIGKLLDLSYDLRQCFLSPLDANITTIYHYTSPIGFQSILSGDDQQKSVTLWATRYDCLNDQSEGMIAKQAFYQVCDELRQENQISEKFYHRLLHVKPDGPTGTKSKNWLFDFYICSFTKNPDSLPMWNYYSKGSKFEGFNIGLNKKQISDYFSNLLMTEYSSENSPNIYISPVIYDYDTQKKYIKAYILGLLDVYSYSHINDICKNLSYELARWSMLFKSKSFETEEEIRAIVQIPQNSYSHEKMPVKYRFSNGMIIPYIELKLEKSAVTSVSFGPLSRTPDEQEMQKTVMQQYLTSAGYENVDIHFSGVPIRF